MPNFLPGTEVIARGLRWELVNTQSLGSQVLHCLRGIEGSFAGQELDLLGPVLQFHHQGRAGLLGVQRIGADQSAAKIQLIQEIFQSRNFAGNHRRCGDGNNRGHLAMAPTFVAPGIAQGLERPKPLVTPLSIQLAAR